MTLRRIAPSLALAAIAVMVPTTAHAADGDVTRREFRNIEMGMTLEQVERRTKAEGEFKSARVESLVPYRISEVIWFDNACSNGGPVKVTFTAQNGEGFKVTAKSARYPRVCR